MIVAVDEQYRLHSRGERVRVSFRHGRCWTLRLLYRAIDEFLRQSDLASGGTVLDYGCGNCPYRPRLLQTFGQYLAADLPGNPNANITLGPAGAIPLPDGSVDCVLSSQVLEHVSDPVLYLAEAARVVRRGGHLLLSTHGIWPYHPDPFDYWRWTYDGLDRTIEQGGFTVVDRKSVLCLPSVALQLLQDAAAGRLPRLLRAASIVLCQALIGLCERCRPDVFSNTASVFVVLAVRK